MCGYPAFSALSARRYPRPMDDAPTLAEQAGRLKTLAQHLRVSAAHADEAAVHADGGDAPRMAAHLLAAHGGIRESERLVDTIAIAHARAAGPQPHR